MALTGIQIFKLLPKTNCKECGVPTCLAFAMNLASGKAELDACPYVSDEAREQLSEASAPPIRPVAVGKGVRAASTGGETVQYRHEKTFYNPTLLAAVVGSDITAADLDTKLKAWNAFQFERVGLNLARCARQLPGFWGHNTESGITYAVAQPGSGSAALRAVLELGFIQQAAALFVDDLPRLGDGMVNCRLQLCTLIGADKPDSPGFAIRFAADKSGGTILAILVDRCGFDRETLVVNRFGWWRLRGSGRAAEQRFEYFSQRHGIVR